MSEDFTPMPPARNVIVHEPAVTLAVAILALGMVLFTAFQTFLLVRARQNLNAARAGQEQPLQDAKKARDRVEALAGRTAQLADGGNANAKTIVENFKKQGIELKPPVK